MDLAERLAIYPAFARDTSKWVDQCLRRAVLNQVDGEGMPRVDDWYHVGTLMDESISRSAGASHGQEMTPQEMELIILATGRRPRQRTTLYADADSGLRQRSFDSAAARMSSNQDARAHSATHA